MITLLIGGMCTSCGEHEVDSQRSPLWGDLEAGDYAVGFKTLFEYDLSRPSVQYTDWPGKMYATPDAPGRQMQINIWYPARSATERLRYGHYIDLMGMQTDFSEMTEARGDFARQQFITKTNTLAGSETLNTSQLEELCDLPTAAHADAEPLDGPFPLIVFPNGGSPAFQSIMCEYLASHGYIVASFSVKGTDVFTDETSARGLEIAASDIAFCVQVALAEHGVDPDRVTFIGNANTSSQIITYISRGYNASGMVSLEGGLLSSFEQRLLNGTAFYDPKNITVPILAIYAPHPSIDPSNIFHLNYSDRKFVHFPQMTEFHCLNYGMFEAFVPGILGDHSGNVVEGYQLVCRTILAFVEGETWPPSFVSNTPLQIDTFFEMASVPSPPSLATIKNEFWNSGFACIDSVHQRHEAPYSLDEYVALRDWLAWQKDPDYRHRYALYQLAGDVFPESPEVFYYLAYYSGEMGDTRRQREHIDKALGLLDSGGDPTLTHARTTRIRQALLEM